jgi:membrane-associated phospholipid phosphatase
MIFAGLGGAAIWYFRPRGVERPVVALKGPFSRLVAWTYSHDPRYNAFPSSHVFTAFLCSYYLVTVYPTHDILIWGTGSTIMASTLLVKQHHLIDVFGGLAVAVLSIGASYFLIGGIA